MVRKAGRLSTVVVILGAHAAPGASQTGSFESGKMWTFEYPPVEYFSERYGFEASMDWFRRARLAALRIPGCSAAFVSPHGLVATNHHCVRGAITPLAEPGENILDDGFYAPALEQERRIPGHYADQLIAIEDVSDEVFAAIDAAASDEERDRLRSRVFQTIQERLQQRHASASGPVRVEVVALYHGGRYSAYVFRRYTDVRLVAAAELQLGFFGGDADNFTYPRHALDFAFLRIYGEDGEPLEPEQHFAWSAEGTAEGDVVFVIGNPGPTNRLNTVAQLEYLRDVQIPATVAWLDARHSALDAYRRMDPEQAERIDVRNLMFSLSNSLKANRGRLAALNDPAIMERRVDAESRFREAIQAQPELRARYGSLLDSMAVLQRRKAELRPQFAAFLQLGNPTYSSATLRRALAAHAWLTTRDAVAADSAEALRRRILAVRPLPDDLERRYLVARLHELQRNLEPEHPVARAILSGRTPENVTALLLDASVLSDSARAAQALERGAVGMDDVAVRIVSAILPELAALQREMQPLLRAEAQLAERLGRARFDVHGTTIPPDATFSPRITDGVVRGYPHNGTVAPPHTTFYGMYDLYHAFGEGTDWDLPDRWVPPPAGLDLATSLNFVSTADTYGGNSGSPAVTPELAIVGLNFDRNIEGLTRDFIYLPERGRNVMVDVRAILEALDDVYDADRIVMELTTGRLFRTEAEADAARR